MFKKNGSYDTLFNFYTNKKLNITKEIALNKIEYWKKNNNIYQIDFIDYEQLTFIEMKFLNDDEVLEKVYELKQIIADNFELKQKLLFKIGDI